MWWFFIYFVTFQKPVYWSEYKYVESLLQLWMIFFIDVSKWWEVQTAPQDRHITCSKGTFTLFCHTRKETWLTHPDHVLQSYVNTHAHMRTHTCAHTRLWIHFLILTHFDQNVIYGNKWFLVLKGAYNCTTGRLWQLLVLHLTNKNI